MKERNEGAKCEPEFKGGIASLCIIICRWLVALYAASTRSMPGLPCQ